MMGKAVGYLSALAFMLASLTWAQTSGTIQGAVRDTQGLVIPGVAVTLRGPAVLGEQTTVTVEDGTYRFRGLGPGNYNLRFELAGFQTLIREGIVVEGNQTFTVDATLPLASVSEAITVSGESPLVDLKNTSLTNQFDKTELHDVPSATDVWSVLAQTPGVRMLGFDVGGSHKSQQSAYESFGIRSQNRVISDGVDSTESTGAAGLYYDYYSIEEFTTSAAGADVEMTSGGSMIVMTVKSGGNEFSGLFHADYEGEGMVSNNEDEELNARGYTGNPTLLFYELHGDLGGPIKKDRFWFFGFYNHFHLEKEVSGVDPATGTAIADMDQFGGKLSWKLTEKDQFVGYTQYQRKQEPYRGLTATIPPESTLTMHAWAWVHKAEWQRVWSERAFSATQAKLFGLDLAAEPRLDYRTDPPRVDTATGMRSGAGFLPGVVRRFKPQVTSTLKYYLPSGWGSHDFKFGFDWQIDSCPWGASGSAGSVFYDDNSLVGRPHNVDEIELYNLPAEGENLSEDRNRHTDVFAQDTWTLSDRLSFLLGVRFGRQDIYYVDAVIQPEQTEFFPSGVIPGQDVITWNMLAPRLGVTLDLTGKGRTVLKGHYGRYYDNAADLFSTVNPASLAVLGFKFLDPNQNGLYDGPQELGSLVYQEGTVGGSLEEAEGTRYNPDLEPAYVDEISVSLEHELTEGTSLRLSYVRKEQRRMFYAWNRAQVLPLLENPIPCGDAVFPCPPNPFTGEPISTLVRVPAEAAYAQDPLIDIYPEPFDNADYDTMQVGFNRRFERRFFVQGSFDYQWRNEPRSAAADVRTRLVTDPIWVDFFQNHNPAVNNLQRSTNWGARLLGRYILPADFAVSANVRHQSGFPWAPIHRVNMPGSGSQPFFLENIRNNRSENVTIVDVRLEKGFHVGARGRLVGMVDVYNLFNSNPETNFILRTGPAFRSIIAVLDPRAVKVGVRFQF